MYVTIRISNITINIPLNSVDKCFNYRLRYFHETLHKYLISQGTYYFLQIADKYNIIDDVACWLSSERPLTFGLLVTVFLVQFGFTFNRRCIRYSRNETRTSLK